MLFTRISQLGARHMPPLGATELDQEAIRLVAQWITDDLAGVQISSINVEPDGRVRINFSGVGGRSYRVEASVDLSTWQTIGPTQAAPDGRAEFLDPALIAPGLPGRFYRIAWP